MHRFCYYAYRHCLYAYIPHIYAYCVIRLHNMYAYNNYLRVQQCVYICILRYTYA